jgi:tetratricopeptide (TPR) repeat protein
MSKENIVSEKLKSIINLINKNDFIEAETALIKIVGEKDNDFYPHQLLGILYSKTGEFEKAKKHFENSIKISPKNPGLYFDLGTMYQLLNDDQKTLDCFLKVIELNPNIIDAYLNIANIYDKQKKIVEANKFFQKALSLKKDYLPSNKAYSYFLIKHGEITKGLSYQYKHLGIIQFNKENLKIF